MVVDPSSDSFEEFLAELRGQITQGHAQLVELYDVFAQEARFGRQWLAGSLAALPKGSTVLEVGGGLMLLSAELQRDGYQVTALEPIGIGFSSFNELQKIVLEFAASRGHAPKVIATSAEQLTVDRCFDFAFSVNVMEHVSNVSIALFNITTALKTGKEYRFFCANYSFPYEPHFNIPTFFSKAITEKIMGKRIFNNKRVADPIGMWTSINWISVRAVTRIMKKIPGGTVRFERTILRDIFTRVISDDQFASRRSVWMVAAVKLVVWTRIHYLFQYLPASFMPIMDCTVSQS